MSNLENKFAGKTTPVVVAKVQIPVHTKITTDMIEIKKLPINAVHPLSSKKADEVLGQVSNVAIEASEQILTTRLNDLGTKSAELSYSIKEGYRALTIKTDEITGVAGQIVSGDRIDILTTMVSGANGANGLASMMVAENIEVLDVGIKQSDTEETNVTYTSVTISVLAEDVLKVNYALTEGKYSLVLRSVADKNIVNPPAYTAK